MTMTAISKGFQRVMKLLYEYGNRQECNTELKVMRTNAFKTAKTDQQNNEHLSEFDFSKNIYQITQYIYYLCLYMIYDNLFVPLDYHMEKLLKQLSLEKYWPVFDKQNIRYNDFLKLSEQDLKDIGIKSVYLNYLIIIVYSL